MEVNYLPLFPIPIGIYNFGKENHELNINLVKDSFLEKEKDPLGEDHSNFGGWHSKVDLETKYTSYKQLAAITTKCGNNYCKTHGYKEGILSKNIWSTINRSGDLNFMHHHGTTALAGVYYPIGEINGDDWKFNYTKENPIKAGSWNNQDGGSLVFQDPSYSKKIHLLTDNSTPYNIDCYHLYPTASVLVLFPTYLLHMVLPFRENKTRVSISFSFQYE